MPKKDVMGMLEEEGKKEKKKAIKSLQEMEKEKSDANKEQILATVNGFWDMAIKYKKIDDILFLELSDGVDAYFYKIVKLEDLKEICKKVEELDTFYTDFISFEDLKRITDKDYRMLEGKDVDGNKLEMDMENVLLIKFNTAGFDRLKTVGSVRIPKGIRVIKISKGIDKYLNL